MKRPGLAPLNNVRLVENRWLEVALMRFFAQFPEPADSPRCWHSADEFSNSTTEPEPRGDVH